MKIKCPHCGYEYETSFSDDTSYCPLCNAIKNADSYENAIKELQLNVKKLKEEIGAVILPIIRPLAQINKVPELVFAIIILIGVAYIVNSIYVFAYLISKL